MPAFDIVSTQMPDITLVEVAFNLACCTACAFLLRYTYIKRSVALAGKFHIGTVIPILSIVVFLVIMVVKSSLALSLGLVGALSIVRFRTPIKEPEELVYLFLAIALGLGFGAGQTIITISVFFLLILIVVLFLSRSSVRFDNEYNLVLDWSDTEYDINKAIEILKRYSTSIELAKYGSSNGMKSAFLKLRFNPEVDINILGKELSESEPTLAYSFYEARPLQ